MTDNSTRYSDNISEKLAFYVALIRQENSNNMQSRNIRAEGFFAAFLNALKGWKLVNLNDERQNAPGLDLIDRKNKVIVQVSSTFSHDKIQDALKHSDVPAYQGYHFYFMAITDHYRGRGDFEPTVRIEFDRKTDIFDTGKLLKTVQGLDIAQQKALSELVDQYFEKDLKASLRCLTEMPPLANTENVICRETELADVQKLLREGKRVLMSGFGGIGKTALARLVFHTVKGEYDEVAWVPYSGGLEDSMMASFTVFNDVRDPVERWRLIAGLKNDGLKKLFVIDNADVAVAQDPKTDAYLQSLTGWPDTAVIVTSRLDGLDSYSAYPIGFLPTEADCVRLFYLYYQNDPAQAQRETAGKLAALAKKHTFTIELLAKGANCEDDLEQYYQELVERGFAFPEIEVNTAYDNAAATIAKHLKKLFDMRTRTPEQTALLWDFAVLPEGASLNKREIKAWFDIGVNPGEQLVRAGWLSQKGGRYAMHPLVREIIKLHEMPEDTAAPFLAFIANYHNGYFPEDEGYTERIRRLELASAVLDDVCKGRDTRQVAHIFDNLGWACRQLARYDDALRCYHKALAIKENLLGKEHPDTATTYNNLALVFDDMNDLPKALKLYENALAIRKVKLGNEHIDTAQTYNNLANVYYHLDDYSKALEYLKKALVIREAKLGNNHPDTAQTYNNLGNAYYCLGNVTKALEYYEKALTIKREKLGIKHSSTAITYWNLGALSYGEDQYLDAMHFFLLALQAFLVKQGYEHPHTRNTCGWLFDSYQAQNGEIDSFLPWLREQLNAEEKSTLEELLKE